ncbi:cupredoxin domain-containing protein [Aquabacterium sp.]|uniref:cupredoxin domain-containing protein n=1 Tax=Aquabacterium sp. TaxID=1872578 RepID=UPI002C8EBC72|nr:cupredoxin family protein [Aquabacterium sp.]HSW08681.1 cupredoxin family protein [Aquabacterium sp.]
MNTDFRRSVAATALLLACATALAHGDQDHAAPARTYDPTKVEEKAFGREGDPKKVVRTIALMAADTMRFTPETITVKRGQTVRFVIRNQGKLLHEMVLGTTQDLQAHAALMKKFPEMEHEEAHMAHVKPGARGDIVWQFTQPGEYQFACLLPGHFEAGMVGKVIVK